MNDTITYGFLKYDLFYVLIISETYVACGS